MNAHAVPISRRTVLVGAGAIALAGCGSGMPGSSISDSPSAKALGPVLATAEASAWMAAVGSNFRAGGYTMRLAGVELMGSPGSRPAALRQQTFIAAFDIVSGGEMPGELLYSISHASIPTFQIFLNNSATDPARMHALFN